MHLVEEGAPLITVKTTGEVAYAAIGYNLSAVYVTLLAFFVKIIQKMPSKEINTEAKEGFQT
ncbi:hypothetical protein A8L34_23345 [Bacillus sp. FJAT-27264]|uniref:hypothetical protein n=1 Tax=Paenibacillus sp. (strain DSM 101736 / FJAT-27264) TaxID=1850362 RepID=UPI000807BF48|nr:hypothetical protein [Bacillus sp. FJAT-27264]OBZ09081.1 hypothetical protein A8L34_23345 [Bacillus sp. FJAT-27264]